MKEKELERKIKSYTKWLRSLSRYEFKMEWEHVRREINSYITKQP